MASIIYHLVWRSDWDSCSQNGSYRPRSLETEGFVHGTRERERLEDVLRQFFNPRNDCELLVVSLDEQKVGAPVVDEDPGVGHRFPHIYGPVSLQAVTAIDVVLWKDDRWILPDLSP